MLKWDRSTQILEAGSFGQCSTDVGTRCKCLLSDRQSTYIVMRSSNRLEMPCYSTNIIISSRLVYIEIIQPQMSLAIISKVVIQQPRKGLVAKLIKSAHLIMRPSSNMGSVSIVKNQCQDPITTTRLPKLLESRQKTTSFPLLIQDCYRHWMTHCYCQVMLI